MIICKSATRDIIFTDDCTFLVRPRQLFSYHPLSTANTNQHHKTRHNMLKGNPLSIVLPRLTISPKIEQIFSIPMVVATSLMWVIQLSMFYISRHLLASIVTEKSGSFCGTMVQNGTSGPKTVIVTEKPSHFCGTTPVIPCQWAA